MKILLWGVKRIQAQATSARVQLPITASLMRRIKAQLSLPPTSFLKVHIWAACSMGFFGFLRAGEFLVLDGVQFDPSRHLSLADIVLDTSVPRWRFLVTIKALQQHPDKDFVGYILQGIRDGFSIGFQEALVALRPSKYNIPSAYE